MNSFDTLKKLRKTSPSIIAIGTFDGVHSGHRYLLQKLLEYSNSDTENLEPTVLTFNRSPKEIITNQYSPLICSIDEKKSLLRDIGIKNIISLDFDKEIKRLTGGEFILHLKDSLNIHSLVLGEDTFLGNDRIGAQNGLEEILRKIEVSLISVSNKEHRDLKISSSYIKKALMDGDVKKANLLLERNYILSGQVIEGKKYGSKLGYPTANIETKEEKIIPKDGIYKTSTTVDNKEYRSVTSIGDNPTFNETEKSVETFIINFDKNIYGKVIKIAFEDFIRDQIKFDDIGDLKRQMSVDVEYIANSKE